MDNKANSYTVLLLYMIEQAGGVQKLMEKLRAGKFDRLHSGISRVTERDRLEKLENVLWDAMTTKEAEVFRKNGFFK